MINRILTLLFCAMLLAAWAGPAGAVEKKAKDKKPKQGQTVQTDTQAKKDTTGRTDSARKTTNTTPSRPTSGQHFDTFVDQNNNGIDDRRENLKNKAVASDQQARLKAPAPSKASTTAPQKKAATSTKADKKSDSTKKDSGKN